MVMELIEAQKSSENFRDKYFLSYVLFYALGVVSVAYSNFFITATDYWMYKFRDVGSNESYSGNNKTTLQAEFTADYSIVSHVSFAFFILLTMRFIRNRASITKRIVVPLAGIILVFVITCIFVTADTDSWQRGFFVTTLVVGFVLTGLSGVFIVTLFEMVAKFPHGYLPAIFSGFAICGIFSALMQILALGIGGSPESTGLVYFLMGMLFIFFTLIAFLTIWKISEFFKFHATKELESTIQLKFTKDVIVSGLNKSKFYVGSVVITLAGSVVLYPGVTTLVVSVDKGNGNEWNDIYFVPVINFLIFHLFDYVGREAAVILKRPTNGIILLIISCCRIPLVPMIMLCNAQPRHNLPVVFDTDYAYIIFLIIFAFTNGYVLNLSMVRVPQITNDATRPFSMLCIFMLMLLSLALSSPISTALVKML